MPNRQDSRPNADTPLVLDEGALDQVRGGTGGRAQVGDIIFTKNLDKSSPQLATGGPSRPPPPPKPAN